MEENKNTGERKEQFMDDSSLFMEKAIDENNNTADALQPETTNDQPQTENMEVHHHTHPAHGKKTWKEYFWEFLMLFLAVFCGFLAEYQLEHVIEHQREKAYIKSYVEDVKEDTKQLKIIISKIDSMIRFRDSLLAELGSPGVISNSNKAYYFLKKSYHFPDFIYNDRTIQQLKNSGGMRLLRNKEVSDHIMDYDAKVRTLFIHQQQMNVLALNFVGSINSFFQKRMLENDDTVTTREPVALLTSDKKTVEEFYNNMSDQKQGFIMLKKVETELLLNGENLVAFIEKEYRPE